MLFVNIAVYKKNLDLEFTPSGTISMRYSYQTMQKLFENNILNGGLK